jgi:DNA invertase Pin-like site-specific DNA recombinase
MYVQRGNALKTIGYVRTSTLEQDAGLHVQVRAL